MKKFNKKRLFGQTVKSVLLKKVKILRDPEEDKLFKAIEELNQSELKNLGKMIGNEQKN